MNHKFLTIIKVIVIFVPFLFCFRVSASAAPNLSQATYQLIEGGNSQLFQSSFSSIDVSPIDIDNARLAELVINASGNPVLTGASLNAVSTSDVTIRSLTDSEKSSNSDVYPYLYDINGNIVNWDNVYFAHYDNGFCHGELYVDGDGNILTSDNSQTLTMFQLGLGGKLLGVDDLSNIYSLISDQLEINQMNYSINDDVQIGSNKLSCFYLIGYKYSSSGRRLVRVFFPNVYATDTFINSSSFPSDFYFNESPSDHFTIVSGNANVFSTSANVPFNGKTYSHRYFLSSAVVNSIQYVNDINDFINGSNGYYVIDYNGFQYNNNLKSDYNSNNIVSFKPLQLPGGSTKLLQIDDTYSYNDISSLENSLNNIQPSTNSSYDPNIDINSNNYPLTYTVNVNPLSSSTLPFPQVSNNPITDSMPYLSYDPLIQPTPEASVQSFWNFQIPFVENLFKKYPFSIPWDIKNFFVGFTSTPQAPAWDFDWSITVLGETYTTHFEGDLSDFEPLAVIFRNLVTISFIVFLAIYSYFKHS